MIRTLTDKEAPGDDVFRDVTIITIAKRNEKVNERETFIPFFLTNCITKFWCMLCKPDIRKLFVHNESI